MTGPALRARMKGILPQPLWTAAARAYGWAKRCLTWRAVMREVKGATRHDRLVLRRSLLRGLKRTVRNLDRWQDPELMEDADVLVPGVGSFHVRAYTDDLYHVLPSREAMVVSTITERLRSGSVFVDAGANIGFFTVLAAPIVGPAGRVIAIEMMPDTAERLRMHVTDNGLSNVTILQHALADRDGDAVTATVPLGKFGQASIARPSKNGGVTVQTITLDTLLQDCGAIDLMKMDLESAEFAALQGASNVLERTTAVIFEQLAGDDRAAQLLERSGFQITMLDQSNALAVRMS